MSHLCIIHNNEKVEITVRGRLQTKPGIFKATPKRDKCINDLGDYDGK
jgi:hypothetical protein